MYVGDVHRLSQVGGPEFDDNWGLEDPTGQPDEEFKIIISKIENRILQLRNELI